MPNPQDITGQLYRSRQHAVTRDIAEVGLPQRSRSALHSILPRKLSVDYLAIFTYTLIGLGLLCQFVLLFLIDLL